MVLAVSQATPSFDSLFLAEFNQIFGYVQRLVGDLAAAHRLTEETFHQLARYYRKGRKPIEARALLYLIATQRARAAGSPQSCKVRSLWYECGCDDRRRRYCR